jgi:hypothetical protein
VGGPPSTWIREEATDETGLASGTEDLELQERQDESRRGSRKDPGRGDNAYAADGVGMADLHASLHLASSGCASSNFLSQLRR